MSKCSFPLNICARQLSSDQYDFIPPVLSGCVRPNLSAQLVSTILRFDGWGSAKSNYISFILEAYVKELVILFALCSGNNFIMLSGTTYCEYLTIARLIWRWKNKTNQHIGFLVEACRLYDMCWLTGWTLFVSVVQWIRPKLNAQTPNWNKLTLLHTAYVSPGF